MNPREPQRVTRTYARGLIAAVTILAIALLIASWGGLSLLLDRNPVTTDVPAFTAPLLVILSGAVLIVILWRQVLDILRGSRPGWIYLVIVPGLAYLMWCVGGLIAGLSVEETWLSPFALTLALCWVVALLMFWAVFLRKVYGDRGTPQWPWEKHPDDDLE